LWLAGESYSCKYRKQVFRDFTHDFYLLVHRQLGPISDFMFNSYCGALDGFFAQMAHYGIMKEEDTQCFSVQGYIEPGSVILAIGAVSILFLLPWHFCHQTKLCKI